MQSFSNQEAPNSFQNYQVLTETHAIYKPDMELIWGTDAELNFKNIFAYKGPTRMNWPIKPYFSIKDTTQDHSLMQDG